MSAELSWSECQTTLLAATFCLGSLAYAADRFPVDWTKLQFETLDYYMPVIKIDTSNPPGDETKVVDYLKPILDRAGIPTQLLALDPKRANLIARIKGNGSKRPLIIMGHTDVVGVQRETWPQGIDPFAALRKDGYVWGSGTSDDNSQARLCTLHRGLRQQFPVEYLARRQRGESKQPVAAHESAKP